MRLKITNGKLQKKKKNAQELKAFFITKAPNEKDALILLYLLLFFENINNYL